jgi:hypothetical protein
VHGEQVNALGRSGHGGHLDDCIEGEGAGERHDELAGERVGGGQEQVADWASDEMESERHARGSRLELLVDWIRCD